MRILLFSYWSINEGIAKGTLFPLMKELTASGKVERTYLCTIEPSESGLDLHLDTKTVHLPIYCTGQVTASKIWLFLRISLALKKIITDNYIDLMWCKGASAGGIGSFVHVMTGVPFVVDSFEPHSEYMAGSGTWSRFNPKYLLQRCLEQLTIRRARNLLPVSREFFDVLKRRGVGQERLVLLPCVVDIDKFAFNAEARRSVRSRLSIKDDWVVGIYVGKFGGLYYDDESFLLYKVLFDGLGEDFFLIILTEADLTMVRLKIEHHGLPGDRIFISKADHSDVAEFLSASDFGISTIKSVPPMRYCSPIKHGEYWAAGLPILTTLGIGDDAEIIKTQGGGVFVRITDSDAEFTIADLTKLLGSRNKGIYSKLAHRYRHPSALKNAVEFVLNRSVTI